MTIKYKQWEITYNPKPMPDRSHDYDVSHIDYDGPGDVRCFTCASLDDAIAEIDNFE
jgi:hypothetical protein